jgi:pyruvate dehydrogenase E1 component beta subunit
MRKLTYSQALNEALHQLLKNDARVFLIGQGVISPWYVGTTTVGLIDEFGPERVIDTPVSENAITGTAVGAALAGMRPIVMHPRMDFMYYAMDQIANHAANYSYMFGGQTSVPMTIWGIINRGGEQAAQHSQAIHAMFGHIPGLKVVMPSTAYDVKGLLMASIEDDNPVLLVDERWLYELEDDVPEELYTVPIGEGVIRKEGNDATIVATSYLVYESIQAADLLAIKGIEAEVIDLRSLKPMDEQLVLGSVQKTGRVVVADGGWKSFGAAAEIAALVSEKAFSYLKGPVKRVTLPDAPAPASKALEKAYYPNSDKIANTVRRLISY